ncbi:MAG: flagellar biosynthetic protein FliO [Pseudomonadota bacterium]
MTYYIVKLLIILPLMAGLIYGALWLYRKYQPGVAQAPNDRELKCIESLPMGTAGKLSIIDFAGQKVLISVTRSQITHLATAAANGGKDPSGDTRSFGEMLNEKL